MCAGVGSCTATSRGVRCAWQAMCATQPRRARARTDAAMTQWRQAGPVARAARAAVVVLRREESVRLAGAAAPPAAEVLAPVARVAAAQPERVARPPAAPWPR